MGEKNWPKSAKKCQKEPKFVFRAQAPLPACWPEGPAAGATKGRARAGKLVSIYFDGIFVKFVWSKTP